MHAKLVSHYTYPAHSKMYIIFIINFSMIRPRLYVGDKLNVQIQREFQSEPVNRPQGRLRMYMN